MPEHCKRAMRAAKAIAVHLDEGGSDSVDALAEIIHLETGLPNLLTTLRAARDKEMNDNGCSCRETGSCMYCRLDAELEQSDD